MKKIAAILLFVMSFNEAVAQLLGGQQAFTFLKLPAHAYQNGLGSMGVATAPDVAAVWQSPALLDTTHKQQVVLTVAPYLAAARLVNATYGLPVAGRWAVGVQYVHYGTMPFTDAVGNELGTFSATDGVLAVSHARQEGNITLGATFKLAASGIAGYQSWAVLTDLAGVFKHPKKDIAFGLAVKNAGFFLRRFSPTDASELPFDVQLSVAFKPQFMPIRFLATIHHLHAWDISYNDPALNFRFNNTGNRVAVQSSALENLARHLVVGTEVLLHKNFRLLLGYNHLRRQEMRLATASGGAGFSFGMLIPTRRFGFSYAYAIQHVAGGLHSFSFRF